MHRILPALVAALLVAGCSDNSNPQGLTTPEPTPEPVATQSATVDTPAPVEDDELTPHDVFTRAELMKIGLDRSSPGLFEALGEEFLLEFADTICDSLDRGLTLEGVAAVIVTSDIDEDIAIPVTAAAIYSSCPQHMED